MALQETRQSGAQIRSVGNFWVVSAPCTSQGIGGCQVWFSKSPFTSNTRGQIGWCRGSLSVVHSSPQILIVLAEAGGLCFACVSAHAPISSTREQVLQQWWMELASAMAKVPRHYAPLLCIDGNARFAAHPLGHTDEAPPACANGYKLKGFIGDQGLTLSKQLSCTGKRIISWTSPNGKPALLDYIAVPRAWMDCFHTLDQVALGDLHQDIDHQPVLCELRWQASVSRDVDCKAISEDRLAQPEAHAIIAAAFATIPPVGWEVDPTSHVHIIQHHLTSFLQQHLPTPRMKPRHPALSTGTLELIRAKRSIRSRVRCLRRRADVELLHLFFKAWAGADVGTLRRSALRVRRSREGAEEWRDRLRAHDRQLTSAIAEDKAEFLRAMHNRAREDGAADFAFLIRSLLRVGRKFKTPTLIPVLSSAGKDTKPTAGRAEVLQVFAQHFGAAERAKPVDKKQHLLQYGKMCHLHETLDADQLPSLACLCKAFASLARGKAPGLSGLRTTLFRAAPHLSALTYYPVVCKTIVRGCPPCQWTGGKAVPIPKCGKPASSIAAWRSVLLLESDGKALQRALRSHLIEVFQQSRAPAQHGGLPRRTLTLPSATVRAHLLALHSASQSGGVVFVDSASAYYSIVRDFITIDPAACPPDSVLWDRAAALYENESDQAAFVQHMKQGNLLDALQASPTLRRYVAGHLRHGWFVTDEGLPTVCRSETGTAPGSPIADTLFGLIYARFLTSMDAQLKEKGIMARLHDLPDAQPGQPTWADDTAILFTSRRAEDVTADLAEVASLMCAGLTRLGLSPNFAAGKTETMLVWKGSGCRAARRSALCQAHPAIPFLMPDGTQNHIRIVPGYVHLGNFIQGDLHELPCIQHRAQLMRSLFEPLRKKLLSSQFLSVGEKTRLLSERVFPRFLHGAGLWRLATRHEQEAFHSALASVVRASLRPILGLTCQGLDATEACAALGVPTSAELLTAARARAWCEVAGEGDVYTWQSLVRDGVWMADATRACADILAETRAGPLPDPACLDACKAFANTNAALLRSAIRNFQDGGFVIIQRFVAINTIVAIQPASGTETCAAIGFQ